MVSQSVVIKNPTGLHLGPAGTLCKEAIQYKSLSVLGACVKSGDEIKLICEGVDEKEALDHLVAVIEGGLGE